MMTPKERAVMQQALEALEELWFARTAKTHEALAALREALAEQVEQKQEPVAYKYKESSPETGEFVFAAPVRTKDLTDEEIRYVLMKQPQTMMLLDKIRAVIAAHKEKNRGDV